MSFLNYRAPFRRDISYSICILVSKVGNWSRNSPYSYCRHQAVTALYELVLKFCSQPSNLNPKSHPWSFALFSLLHLHIAHISDCQFSIPLQLRWYILGSFILGILNWMRLVGDSTKAYPWPKLHQWVYYGGLICHFLNACLLRNKTKKKPGFMTVSHVWGELCPLTIFMKFDVLHNCIVRIGLLAFLATGLNS